MSKKYDLPSFLSGNVSPQSYLRWLGRKSSAHVRRDKRRGNTSANNEAYKVAIHRAVLESAGRDDYTGESLNWSLISRYSNAESKVMRRQYKAGFALLPTVDHVGDGLGRVDFKICSWRTNDAKHDLTYEEFVELCRRVVAHFDGAPKDSKLESLGEQAKAPRGASPKIVRIHSVLSQELIAISSTSWSTSLKPKPTRQASTVILVNRFDETNLMRGADPQT